MVKEGFIDAEDLEKRILQGFSRAEDYVVERLEERVPRS